MIDLDFVRGLIDAVNDSGIDSLEITRAGTRIRINKTPPPAPVAAPQVAAPAAAPQAVPQVVSGNSGAPAPAMENPGVAELEAARAESSGLVDVVSPMVGTFYRAPAPEAPPYVEVGSRVTKGQTLCILEAMKLMNELECEADGVIREVLVENAEPVEYGQVLFRIDPNG